MGYTDKKAAGLCIIPTLPICPRKNGLASFQMVPTMTLQNQLRHQKGKYQTLEMEKLRTRSSTLTSSDTKEREMRSPS